jgi:hypothetical protein
MTSPNFFCAAYCAPSINRRMPQRCLRGLWLALWLTWLSGCALQPTNTPVATAPAVINTTPSASPTEVTIRELRRLQLMTPAQLAMARDAAREQFERDPAEFRRIQYALTVLASPISMADDERLAGLIEPLLMNAANDVNPTKANSAENVAALALAAVTLQNLQSRRKMREETNLRQRTQVAAKRDDREPEVRALKARVEELEKQLVALKSIERSVNRR